ncbi:hypothetical protein PRNP1_003716 [Phytophthora ramorum]
MMHKCLLLLVTTLVFLSSGDALSPPTVGSTLSKLTSLDMNQATHPVNTNPDKRMLRASDKEEDGATNEERGMSAATAIVKILARSFKDGVKNSKLGKMVAKPFQKVIRYRRNAKVSDLIKKGSSHRDLIKNKVTPDEFFKAKGLSSNLKDLADTPSLWNKNPGLEEYSKYKNFWDIMNAV